MSEANKWKSGDIVRLKSGGPQMTVDAYTEKQDSRHSTRGVVTCAWFSNTNNLPMRIEVDEGALEAVPQCDADVGTAKPVVRDSSATARGLRYEWRSDASMDLIDPFDNPAASGVGFNTLRAANIARLPTFKTAKGETAHSKPDGSDWSPANWMTAVLGELGEAANLMKKVRRQDFGLDEKCLDDHGEKITPRQALAKEFADVVTYLDILAMQYDINLGEAVVAKFNEISKRVGSPIRITCDNFAVIDNDTCKEYTSIERKKYNPPYDV